MLSFQTVGLERYLTWSFFQRGLIAPLILLAERSSRVWLISNLAIWTRLLLWPSFSFANASYLLDKHAFTPRHWHLTPGTVPEGVVQTLVEELVVLGGSFFERIGMLDKGAIILEKYRVSFSTVSGCMSGSLVNQGVY